MGFYFAVFQTAWRHIIRRRRGGYSIRQRRSGSCPLFVHYHLGNQT